MLVNRVSGLVAPASLKYLFDNVIGKHQADLLPRIVLAVIGATDRAGTDFLFAHAVALEILPDE